MLGGGKRNHVSLYCVSVSGRGILSLTSLSQIFRCSLAAVDGVFFLYSSRFSPTSLYKYLPSLFSGTHRPWSSCTSIMRSLRLPRKVCQESCSRCEGRCW